MGQIQNLWLSSSLESSFSSSNVTLSLVTSSVPQVTGIIIQASRSLNIPIVVLSPGAEVVAELSDADMLRCGSAYCPAQIISSTNITDTPTNDDTDVENDNFKTDITKIYIIAGIFLFCSISSALIVAFFVDPLTRFICAALCRRSVSIITGLERMRGRRGRRS